MSLEEILKHLPGRHPQKSHAGSGGNSGTLSITDKQEISQAVLKNLSSVINVKPGSVRSTSEGISAVLKVNSDGSSASMQQISDKWGKQLDKKDKTIKLSSSGNSAQLRYPDYTVTAKLSDHKKWPGQKLLELEVN